ncbi:hypothetical protein BJY27_005987 [Streptomyces rapamycinicus]|uniref:Lipoxygenase domain-containing protein n=2 Tax=Streptomyces rapamycinicus TaxID=1226757 RepID=A0A3L8RIY7_STRRN|nr:hypothetical protein [Streptomyces rapamycinicus]RLV79498.1 hypothetical protein D3C57_113975 [Streptomyces rapamycinicus NRRL 5491]
MLTVPDNHAPALVAGWLWPLVRAVKTEAAPGWHPGDRVQAPEAEEPVITSLTEAEREELARRNAEQNKRSERDVQARGGR